jgi:hypothetical protein
MAIPEHVKRQTMDAVGSKATTAQIRLYCNNDQPAIFNPAEKDAPAVSRPIPDEVRKQAMDAINYRETMSQVRLVDHEGSPSPLGTPSPQNNPLAQRIAWMHQMGHGVEFVHQQMTRDGFGKGYD